MDKFQSCSGSCAIRGMLAEQSIANFLEANEVKTVVKAAQTDVQRQYFTIDLPGRPKHNASLSYTITFRAAEVCFLCHSS